MPRFRIRLLLGAIIPLWRSDVPFIDLAGKRFTRLMVLRISHKRRYRQGYQTYWLCRRDCGKEHVANGARLRRGMKSCGCLRYEARAACNRGHSRAEFGFNDRGKILCRACVRMGARTRILSRANLAIVLEGLAQGLTINQMTQKRSRRSVFLPPPIINKTIRFEQVSNFVRLHPKLGNRMRALSSKNGRQNYLVAMQARRLVAAPALLRNNGADAFEAITRATAGIWEDDRGDVQSLMFIALGEGKLKPLDCTPERAREYLKIHRRHPNVFGNYSLDTPIGEDGTMTWLDTKTDEDRLWA
jgi:hypothetical protein